MRKTNKAGLYSILALSITLFSSLAAGKVTSNHITTQFDSLFKRSTSPPATTPLNFHTSSTVSEFAPESYGGLHSRKSPDHWQGHPPSFWKSTDSDYNRYLEKIENYQGEDFYNIQANQDDGHRTSEVVHSGRARKMLSEAAAAAPSPQDAARNSKSDFGEHLTYGVAAAAGASLTVMGASLVADEVKDRRKKKADKKIKEALEAQEQEQARHLEMEFSNELESDRKGKGFLINEEQTKLDEHRLEKRGDHPLSNWNAASFNNHYNPPPMVNFPEIYGHESYQPPPPPQDLLPAEDFGDCYREGQLDRTARKSKSIRKGKGSRKLKQTGAPFYAGEKDGIGFPPSDQAYVPPQDLGTVVDNGAGSGTSGREPPSNNPNNPVGSAPYYYQYPPSGLEAPPYQTPPMENAPPIYSYPPGVGMGVGSQQPVTGGTAYPGQGSSVYPGVGGGSYPYQGSSGNNQGVGAGNNYGAGGFYNYHDSSAKSGGMSGLGIAGVTLASIAGAGLLSYGGYKMKKIYDDYQEEAGHTCDKDGVVLCKIPPGFSKRSLQNQFVGKEEESQIASFASNRRQLFGEKGKEGLMKKRCINWSRDPHS